jgi:hypothetical protein
MLRDLVWVSLVFMTMNATYTVISMNVDGNSFAGNAFKPGGALSWMPYQYTSKDQNSFGNNDKNIFDINSLPGQISAQQKTFTSIPLSGDLWSLFAGLLNAATTLVSILILLVAGTVIMLSEIGLPVYIVMIIGIPITIITIAGFFILLEHGFSILRGLLPI